MAVSDVYAVCFDLEMPSGPASINFHYQELTLPSSTDGPDGLAGGLMATLVPLLRLIMSGDTAFVQLRAYKKNGDKETPASLTIADGVGLSGGDSMPAQFGAKIVLGQTLFDSSSNGMIWIPGIDEERVTVSLIDAEYLNGPIKDFADQLLVQVEEPAAGDGRWRLVIVSQKFLDANPGDYVGASADATGVSRLPLVGRQKRRRSKVRGGAA